MIILDLFWQSLKYDVLYRSGHFTAVIHGSFSVSSICKMGITLSSRDQRDQFLDCPILYFNSIGMHAELQNFVIFIFLY